MSALADERPAAQPPRGVRGMAIVRWALVALMALLAVGSGLSFLGGGEGSGTAGQAYYCPMHPQIVQDRPGECPICSMNLVPRPTPGQSYHCPMHPTVTSSDPNATCSLCGGMKLLPRAAQSAAATTTTAAVPGLTAIDLPIDRVQKVGIRTARVARQSLGGGLRAAGVVEADERGLASISPRFAGWIEQLLVSETGQRVKRGQPLATIYSPEVLQAQQELLAALGWTASSPRPAPPHPEPTAPLDGLVSDARHRLELLGISAQEVEAIVTARKPQRAIAIRSPVEGHVITKNAVVGMNVSPGTPLFAVADLSTVWVVAEIYEADVGRVRVGQAARFEATAFPGETFAGKVKFLYPTLEAGSRTLRARLELRNRAGAAGLKLRPGMYGNVTLDLPATTGLMVPSEAVVDTGDLQYLFVAREGGHFEPRRVKVGARLEDRIQISEGVSEGEMVVTTANFLIDSESRLRAAISGQR